MQLKKLTSQWPEAQCRQIFFKFRMKKGRFLANSNDSNDSSPAIGAGHPRGHPPGHPPAIASPPPAAHGQPLHGTRTACHLPAAGGPRRCGRTPVWLGRKSGMIVGFRGIHNQLNEINR